MAIFTPPSESKYFFPSKGDMVQWIYEIWKYLSDNPIVTEDNIAQIINDYLDRHPITGDVNSVNGQKGNVVLTADNINTENDISVQEELDVLKAADDTKYSVDNPPPYPVTSVNGQTGAVTGLYSTRNPPPYPVTSVNGQTGAVTGLYSSRNPPPYPVMSVNGKKGNVTLDIPSDAYTPSNPPNYPVTSVGGMLGPVRMFDRFDTRTQDKYTCIGSLPLRIIVNVEGTLANGGVHYVEPVYYESDAGYSLYGMGVSSSKGGLIATISTRSDGITVRLENRSGSTISPGAIIIWAMVTAAKGTVIYSNV